MSNYSTNLKNWGSTGSEFPDNYDYVEGEQPVDEWDNFFNYNTIDDIQHLIDLTNDRLESDSGTSHPSSPEVGHISHRTDGVVTTEEEIFFYDNSAGSWHRFMKASGDKMTGALDMGGYNIEDSSGTLTLQSATEITNPLTVSSSVTMDGSVTANSASLESEWLSKQEGGSISAGDLVVLGQFGLDDGETLQVSQAALSEDGFTTAAASGLNLVLATDPAAASADVVILSGDGSTLYDDETTGWSYTNTTGGHETAVIALDNGHYGSGVGSETRGYGGFIARVE